MDASRSDSIYVFSMENIQYTRIYNIVVEYMGPSYVRITSI